MKCLGLAILALATLSETALAQQPARANPAPAMDYEAVRRSRVVTAVRIPNDTISVDGHLDESAWALTIPAAEFIQLMPRPSEPAQERTEVRFLYDDTNLYVGVTAFQSAPLVLNDITEDWNFGGSDALNLMLDTLHDRRTAFNFMTNPGGARRDAQVSNDGQVNNVDWDGVWDVKVSRNSQGWIAEYQIPFKTLRFSNSPTQEWGFNLTRAVRRRSEQSHWAPIPVRFSALRVSLQGTLRGLENISQGRNLNVKPFMVAGSSQVRTNGRMETTRSLDRWRDYDGGFDAKYSLTPSMTLDATFRTDFAQVEVDQQQVNLTRFNLFFPEKRDFFLENAGTFGFGPGGNLVPFFSRRIGLSAAGTPIPIIGGARVSGQLGAFNTGVLAMKTESLGSTPSNNYLVGRVKRNLFRNSWVGAIGTSRDSTRAGDYNRVYGVDAHFQFFQKLEIDSYVLASDTPGRSGKRQARRLQTEWGDDEFSISGQYNEVQTNFNPEMGFIRRADNTQYQGEVSWKPLIRSSDTIRNLIFTAAADYYKDPSGRLETREHAVTAGVTFESQASANFTVRNTFDRLVQPERIQGLLLPAADYNYLDYTATYTSNATRRISGNTTINWGDFWDGSRRSISGGLSLKPDYHLNVTLNYSRNQLDLLSGASTSTLLGTRIVYGFSPRSFLNVFLQHNSATREISTNVRFNVMYRPLSDFYVVYNDRRDTDGQPIERAFIVKVTRLLTF